MRASHLLLAGIGMGAILTYALFYEPTLQRETVFGEAENGANSPRADTLVGNVH